MFTKVLVPLDHSPLAEQAIGQAAAIARAAPAELDLVLVHEPLPFDGSSDAPWSAEQLAGQEKYLSVLATEIASGASVTATHAVMQGDIVDVICKRAWDVGADLIVMTSHGRTGFSRAWLGSVADGVLRHAAIPVLVLRPAAGIRARDFAPRSMTKILVPLDGSSLALDALRPAADLARCTGARLSMLRVVQPVPMVMLDTGMPFVYPVSVPDDEATERLAGEAKEELASTAKLLEEEGLGAIETHVVVSEHVAPAIIDYAREHGANAIAMSTHGRGASRLFLGSVVDKVLRASGLPMLIRRPIAVGKASVPDSEAVPDAARLIASADSTR